MISPSLGIAPSLETEYVAWISRTQHAGQDDSSAPISIGDVLKAHFMVVDYFFELGEGVGGVGPRSLGILYSALSRQVTSYAGVRKWTDDMDIAATLFYGLIKNHPFHDANKRTALLVMLHHMRKIGRTPSVRQSEFEDLTVNIADNFLNSYREYDQFIACTDPEISFISSFLRRKTRESDKRYYTVTYRQLNTMLGRFGFQLANPSGNYIYVVRDADPSQQLAQIGFPGWTKQVGQGAIKTVRSCTGLTPDNGCDSQVFFRDYDPLGSLINQYGYVTINC